jgi:asparagine synthase (glutamine-hydrolysing)
LRGDSHAELLAHLYEDQGPECFDHVEGPLAAAVWDANRRTLVLARDRLGQKPLFYRAGQGQMLFASSLRALGEAANGPRELDPTALDEYLTFGYVPHPHCLWRGEQKLPPGYVAVYRDGQLTFRRYWRPDLQREDSRSPAELRSDLRQRLEAAVATCAAGDEPLGVWLSGGLDSAIVAALAGRARSQPLHTFTLSSPLESDGKSAAAEALARQIGAEHHVISMDVDAHERVSSFLANLDEPLADPFVLTLRALAEGTAQHVPRVLTGLGADELLAGYPRHGRVLTWREKLPSWVQAMLPGRRPAGGSEQRPLALDEARARQYLDEVSVCDEAARSELYTDKFLAHLPAADPYDLLRAALACSRGRDPVSAVSLADVQTLLPCSHLAACDAAAAAHGLEFRHPFLDASVVELAAAAPGRWKWRRGLGKVLLREAFADVAPPQVVRRGHRASPLPVPWPLAAEAKTWLAESQSLNMVSREAISRLCQNPGDIDDDRHVPQRWALAVLERWLRR